MQVLQGLEDLEMSGEIGLMNRQKVEMVISEWWTWWRWLVHSPTTWKASHEGLKALTPVPNPIRISPQMQVTCGWKKVSCISITTCPCINTSYALWLCLVVWLLIVWVEICLFVFACCFWCQLFACLLVHIFNFVLSIFLFLVSKIQKSHKKN